MSSFLPAKKNFPFWKNATFRYLFEWRDDDGKSQKSHDLTGYTGLCVLEPMPHESKEPITLEVVLYSAFTSGIIFGGSVEKPDNGLVELYVRKELFEPVKWTKATYTLYATEPNPPNDDYPLLTGRFTEAGPPL
jgi:hypothetical protein